jgi:hypothetical protein
MSATKISTADGRKSLRIIRQMLRDLVAAGKTGPRLVSAVRKEAARKDSAAMFARPAAELYAALRHALQPVNGKRPKSIVILPVT